MRTDHMRLYINDENVFNKRRVRLWIRHLIRILAVTDHLLMQRLWEQQIENIV